MWSYYEHATNFKMSAQYTFTLKTVYINKLIIKLFLSVLKHLNLFKTITNLFYNLSNTRLFYKRCVSINQMINLFLILLDLWPHIKTIKFKSF